ncbi:MAG: 2,3-bisphosphoglycerate-independent phosphoglycerate mutase, partial [Treponema sp.]
MADIMHPLQKNPDWKGRRGPVVLVIMDGVGYGKYEDGDAVRASRMKWLDKLVSLSPHTKLKAHGTAVGLPSDDDMGNSEVGHNAMGCGRVFAQGAKLVSTAISTGKMFEGDTWKKLAGTVKNNGTTLHFIGLLSDGNVHSHIDHLKAMITQANKEGVKKIRVHALLDGRDVEPTSALNYFKPFDEFLASFGCDYKIASGGGRMYITMDRYNADWSMVERGWNAHVLGEGRQFASAEEAIETYRKENPGLLDQDMHEFVIAEN